MGDRLVGWLGWIAELLFVSFYLAVQYSDAVEI